MLTIDIRAIDKTDEATGNR